MADTGKKPVVLIGGGGHASVLADILLRQKREILAVISPDDLSERAVFSGLKQLLADQDIGRFSPDEIELVNGIGMMPHSGLREKLNRYYLELGYSFATVVADSAEVSPFAILKDGVQVLPQSLIQAGVVVGAHSIINSKALIEHDCIIGEYNHIAPGSVLCGQVKTGHGVYVGAGAVVFQNLKIAELAIVAGGAILRSDLPKSSVIYPAKSTLITT
ncbi:acetyltransferase [Oceanospirillum sanctuarii]|uniref:acetyltransferase n=1 Tax=Oceanospirillum sanctuarii TaxID=1434821 RepID=UPI000A379F84|nr:acetyltransferase [Oceanospirillum sanctuarii]